MLPANNLASPDTSQHSGLAMTAFKQLENIYIYIYIFFYIYIYIYVGTLTSIERNAASEILAPLKIECSKRPPSPRIGGDRVQDKEDEHPRTYTSCNNAVGPPPNQERHAQGHMDGYAPTVPSTFTPWEQ
jgi:hypothetical protein